MSRFVFPSGKQLQLVGHVPYVVDEYLMKGVEETKMKFYYDVPFFCYKYQDRYKSYVPDMLLTDDNIVVEVRTMSEIRNGWDSLLFKCREIWRNGYKIRIVGFNEKDKEIDKILSTEKDCENLKDLCYNPYDVRLL